MESLKWRVIVVHSCDVMVCCDKKIVTHSRVGILKIGFNEVVWVEEVRGDLSEQ